jgi:CMP-N-acetylneuraminic acid synthetase
MKNGSIISLLIGRKGSKGFPNKNLIKIKGKYIFEYPIIASIKSKMVDEVYISTDCPEIRRVSKSKYKTKIIKRPKYLATNKALGDDVFKHGYEKIKIEQNKKKKKIEFIVLLFANAATISEKQISYGISFLRKNPSFDSAVTVSKYNMWSPLRARKVKKDGSLKPFVPFKTFGNPKTLNCDRDSQGNVYFADMSVSIVRPKCFANMQDNLLPQRWMGKKIAPIYSEAGFDLDFEWQLPQLEYWIKNKR